MITVKDAPALTPETCPAFTSGRKNNRGVVLVIVLWMTILMTVFAVAISAKIRMSARNSYQYKQSLTTLSNRISALNAAKMELLLIRMPKPVIEKDKQEDNSSKRKESWRMNGSDLVLSYRLPEGVSCRIYDHAGKININKLTIKQMRIIIARLLNSNNEKKINSLINSWQDWLDNDNLKRVDGAEKDYYLHLPEPYLPRNGKLESVEELLLIKGFPELLKGINLQEVFTIYGNSTKINCNLASLTTLQLIPGIDYQEAVDIIQLRNKVDIRELGDLAQIIPEEKLKQARRWIGFNTSNYYTIGIYPTEQEQKEKKNQINKTGDKKKKKVVNDYRWGYSETVQVKGYKKMPITLRVDPISILPGTKLVDNQ